jgi:hypothetical protein
LQFHNWHNETLNVALRRPIKGCRLVQRGRQAGFDKAADKAVCKLELRRHQHVTLLRSALGKYGLHEPACQAERSRGIPLDAVENDKASFRRCRQNLNEWMGDADLALKLGFRLVVQRSVREPHSASVAGRYDLFCQSRFSAAGFADEEARAITIETGLNRCAFGVAR